MFPKERILRFRNNRAILTSTDSARRPHFLCKRVENVGWRELCGEDAADGGKRVRSGCSRRHVLIMPSLRQGGARKKFNEDCARYF